MTFLVFPRSHFSIELEGLIDWNIGFPKIPVVTIAVNLDPVSRRVTSRVCSVNCQGQLHRWTNNGVTQRFDGQGHGLDIALGGRAA